MREIPGLRKEFVFDPSEAPFESCHAATVAETATGEYCAAWFGGTKEGARDVSIWMSLGRGGRWSRPVLAARVRDEAHWNPVLFHDGSSGETTLFFKVGARISSWETWVVRSCDGGRTWSDPAELVPGDRGGRGPVKNKPIRLSNGDILAPASIEGYPLTAQQAGLWAAFVDRSRDGGRTWEASPPVPMDIERLSGGRPAGKDAAGVIQPSLWESAPGHVHMLLRSTFGWICRSDSTDYGHTWDAICATNLPNNNSGLDLARLPDGRLFLLCNPVGANWGPRTPLSMFVSADNGATWDRIGDIEDEPAPAGEGRKPEFSYPSVIACSEGLAAVYTWKRRSIVFALYTPPPARRLG
ncbi:MAG: exo-alpha-sialidase [Planctomycetota bacterium]|nr:exo-alpha-sialidase [Planctomycetota bacterium]